MMITSEKEMKRRPTVFSKISTSTKQISSSRRKSLSVKRSIGFLLLLLVLVYTVIFFQSIVSLRHKDDDAPRENNNNINKANRIPVLSSSNHNRQRRQQQQQPKQKPKEKKEQQRQLHKELDLPVQADARLPSSSVGTFSSTAIKSMNVNLSPLQQKAAEIQVLQANDPWISPAASESPPLLLNVPFYVYDDLLWLDDAVVIQEDNDNTTLPQPIVSIPVEEWVLHQQEIKHSEDWWFAKAALSHPKRTMDPSQAKIFVVPALFNTLVHLVMNYNQRKCYRATLCHDGKCGLELLKYANDYLGRSTWFQRNIGNDHFLVASHYRSDWFHTSDGVASNLYNCHVIGMEDRQSNSHNRLHFPSTYVGQSCPHATIKRYDFAFVADILTPSPMFDHRRKMCKWMMTNKAQQQQEFNQTMMSATSTSNNSNTTTTTTTFFTMPFCGAGPQCPTLAEARYGFHLRGDTNGANRLIDTILSGTVPIFTTARQYQVLPEWIDWRMISMHINIRKANKDLFLSNVAKLVDNSSMKEYAEKLEHVIRNRDLVDWTTIIPFDQYMYALSCQLWPDDEIKRRSTSPGGRITTPYSAYLVPRPGRLRQVPKQPGPLPQDRNISTSLLVPKK